MEKGWVIARNFDKLYLAEIAKEVLSDNNINAVILNKKDSSYNNFGSIELYVNENDLERSVELLKEL